MEKDILFLQRDYCEFSIYTEDKDNPIYQIKSNSSTSAEILSYPSKQIMGKLQHHKNGKVIEVAVEFFDNETQRWQKGKIIHTSLPWLKDKVDIEWNGGSLKYIHLPYRVAGAFYKPPDIVFAELRNWRHKRSADYEVEVYSNEIPDPVYLLFIAALTKIINPFGKGK